MRRLAALNGEFGRNRVEWGRAEGCWLIVDCCGMRMIGPGEPHTGYLNPKCRYRVATGASRHTSFSSGAGTSTTEAA